MDDIDYRRMAAQIAITILPTVYKETPERGGMVADRVQNTVNRVLDITISIINEIKSLEL